MIQNIQDFIKSSTECSDETAIIVDPICSAIRPNGLRCVRHRKHGEPYCGTHFKLLSVEEQQKKAEKQKLKQEQQQQQKQQKQQKHKLTSNASVVANSDPVIVKVCEEIDDFDTASSVVDISSIKNKTRKSTKEKGKEKETRDGPKICTSACTTAALSANEKSKVNGNSQSSHGHSRFVSIWVEEIDGICHYIDAFGNVYCHEDILNLSKSSGSGSIEQLNAARKKNSDSLTTSGKTKSKRKSKSNDNVFVKVENPVQMTMQHTNNLNHPTQNEKEQEQENIDTTIEEGVKEECSGETEEYPVIQSSPLPSATIVIPRKPRIIAKYTLTDSVYRISFCV